MKKKTWAMTTSCLLAASLMTGSAFAAKPDGAGNADKKHEEVVQTKVNIQEKEAKHEREQQDSVTSSTYGGKGHNGYHGLLNALDNVKDKPAGPVIAELLLSKYSTQLSAEQKAKLEAVVNKEDALSTAAGILDEQGSVTDAVYVQKIAIKVNVKNLDSYKKLGKLYDKLGKKGVKLYVNGEEPAAEVAPFIRDGSTLVPFRAISEALKAEVKWNPEERSVTVTRNGVTVKLLIDSKTAYVDGKEVTLEVPASIVEGNTVVPVRFVSEALKASVNWESESQSVVITEEE